ncbi:hypothetical protein [Citrobacter freundii]|uniref:hypothetical protein n=1 Tax=Citrobacter freundii TaxID=546 RepID=UPI00160BDA91|nr:hypothetical protein [Citrobacter freundii]QNC76196.1 hypothetical protein F3113_23120 [Citrobacter freundii]QNC95971.1 hypothetical protein F3084_22970 [Citrobacter freundii]QND01117.1 hypothetical protein F3085_23160 [Citrobacter freundii]HAU4420431.1 hypothetical protein [Citrobacter freundii]HAU4425805.1 hypothetical protein [Citrobacter freundii]
MTLELRVEALEAALANQQNAMKEAVSSAIQNALRPGGCLYTALKSSDPLNAAGGQAFIDGASINAGKVKAAQIQAAKSYEEIFEEKLDTIISLLPPLKL